MRFPAPAVVEGLAQAAFTESLRGKGALKYLLPRAYRRLNHPRTLPQGDGCAGPPLAGGPIGRHRYLKILDAGQVLDDFLAINGPHVDAVQEVSSGAHGGLALAAKSSEPRPGKGG